MSSKNSFYWYWYAEKLPNPSNQFFRAFIERIKISVNNRKQKKSKYHNGKSTEFYPNWNWFVRAACTKSKPNVDWIKRSKKNRLLTASSLIKLHERIFPSACGSHQFRFAVEFRRVRGLEICWLRHTFCVNGFLRGLFVVFRRFWQITQRLISATACTRSQNKLTSFHIQT